VAGRLAAGLHAGVARGDHRHAEHGADHLVLGEHALAVGHEEPAPAVAVVRRDLADGRTRGTGRVVRPKEQLDLLGLGDLGRQDAHRGRVGRRTAGERNGTHPATAAPGRRSGGVGRGREARRREIGRVGEARGVAHDDADAGATVVAGGELFHLAVVQVGRRRAPVLDEDLRERPAAPERGVERGVDHGLFEQCRSIT
jgi:hypothetical protein